MSKKQVEHRIAEIFLSKQGKSFRRKSELNHNVVDTTKFQEATTSEISYDNEEWSADIVVDNANAEPMDVLEDFEDIDVNSMTSENIGDSINYSDSDFDSEDYFLDYESFNDRLSLKEEIRQWYLRDPSITRSACDLLLKILKRHINKDHDLPSDIRTLVGKHEKVKPITISGGQSIHFGLKKCVDFIAKSSNELPETMVFDINVDGAPIFDNPYISVSIWPVLMAFKNIKGLEKNVFPISIFCGSKKPDSLDFLNEFIDEYNEMNNGFTIQNKAHTLELDLIRMDVPAHSFLCQTKSHSGYHACFKCDLPGEYYGHKVIYPYVDEEAPRRTNETFRAKLHEEHHVGETNLMKIPDLDLINQIPIDNMHCTYLGVMKKLLSIWFVAKSKSNKFLSNDCFKVVSESIRKLKGSLPNEFHRNLRSLDAINRYKAKELRMFLLYIGPFVLKNQLSNERFTHFLYLHCAIKILSDEDHSKSINKRKLAKRLIDLFSIGMEQIYGKQYYSYNLHLLTHLDEEVALHGPLDNFSNFIFENYLGHLKKFVKSPFNPLQQIANRNAEIFEYSLLETERNNTTFNKEKQSVIIDGISLTCQFPNSIVALSTSEVIRIVKIEDIQKKIYISGALLRLKDYFKEPIRSSTIGCYVAEEDSQTIIKKELTYVSRKMVPFKIKDTYVLIPMTHNIR